MPVNPLGRTESVVDEQGRATEKLSLFSEDVARLSILTGAGSPEGVVSARRARIYMDEEGVAGAVMYIKQMDDIGGDRSLGWVAV